MRISMIEQDAGFFTWLHIGGPEACGNIIILLDGKEVSHCITADTSLGQVLRHAFDESGKCAIDYEKGETIKQRLFGKVEIKTNKGGEQ